MLTGRVFDFSNGCELRYFTEAHETVSEVIDDCVSEFRSMCSELDKAEMKLFIYDADLYELYHCYLIK